MSNLYVPHESVTSHPDFNTYGALRQITALTPDGMVLKYNLWIRGAMSKTFRIIMVAIKWDLIHNYGKDPIIFERMRNDG